jgi:hypothetical protein
MNRSEAMVEGMCIGYFAKDIEKAAQAIGLTEEKLQTMQKQAQEGEEGGGFDLGSIATTGGGGIGGALLGHLLNKALGGKEKSMGDWLLPVLGGAGGAFAGHQFGPDVLSALGMGGEDDAGLGGGGGIAEGIEEGKKK